MGDFFESGALSDLNVCSNTRTERAILLVFSAFLRYRYSGDSFHFYIH